MFFSWTLIEPHTKHTRGVIKKTSHLRHISLLSMPFSRSSNASLKWPLVSKLNQPSNDHNSPNTSNNWANYHQKKRNLDSFSTMHREQDRIMIDLKICKSELLSRYQLHNLDLPSNAHNSTNAIRNWTKLPPKQQKFKSFPTICIQKKFDKLLSLKCLKTNCAPWFKV